MEEESKIIFNEIGLEFMDIKELDGCIIPREELLSDSKYDKIKNLIPNLKKIYSSSCMTSLQKHADKYQKWPLLNLTRQILSVYHYKMEPIRKSDGYTLEGVKKYKRFFQIKKKYTENNKTSKIILLDITDTNNNIVKDN
jgi:hypothetical protein